MIFRLKNPEAESGCSRIFIMGWLNFLYFGSLIYFTEANTQVKPSPLIGLVELLNFRFFLILKLVKLIFFLLLLSPYFHYLVESFPLFINIIFIEILILENYFILKAGSSHFPISKQYFLTFSIWIVELIFIFMILNLSLLELIHLYSFFY